MAVVACCVLLKAGDVWETPRYLHPGSSVQRVLCDPSFRRVSVTSEPLPVDGLFTTLCVQGFCYQVLGLATHGRRAINVADAIFAEVDHVCCGDHAGSWFAAETVAMAIIGAQRA